MAEKLIIPMIVLARNLKRPLQVPALNPNYKTALNSYLGKDSAPGAFNENILLESGVHLHFILPSALKHGTEAENANGEKVFDYTAVPDRFIVTRMLEKGGKVETECSIVESNFYSLNAAYAGSVTIPKFDDLRARHRYRYMGRCYNAKAGAPALTEEDGYFEKITAVGAGDPMFCAYYPSCKSVFGFYDNLDGVPPGSVLSYFVAGVYSNAANDIFHNVKTPDDMKTALSKYDLSADTGGAVCNSSVLFGAAAGIDISKESPVPLGEINIGVGKSSGEALSAVIKEIYYKNDAGMERFLTSVQYDTASEAAQPDGNFKIDDDIHFRGFTRTDSLENTYSLRLAKDMAKKELPLLSREYSDLVKLEHEIGKLRRELEYNRNSLYYLWEIYEGASSAREKQIIEIINPVISKITELRSLIYNKIADAATKRGKFQVMLKEHKAELELLQAQPFYYPADPVVMLFGEGMNRTYAFGEDGRFEADDSLYCLVKPLTCNIPNGELASYFKALSILPGLCENYKDLAVTALLLDSFNILPKLKLEPKINEKYSPVMINGNTLEAVTLLMHWETEFYPDYVGSNPENSVFKCGNTDYEYLGERMGGKKNCSGVTVLTPHGIYNLQDKLKKYLEYTNSPEAEALTEKIRDLAAVSQNLGGFNLSLTALKYSIQYPVDIDAKDSFSKKIAECIAPEETEFYEPKAERLAVCGNTQIFPLREGFFNISKLAITTTFGESRKIIDTNLDFKGTKFFSENLYPVKDSYCFFPLALTSRVRLSAYFAAAFSNTAVSSPLPGASPVIGIFMPDVLNRNLNVFSNLGESIGIMKTSYRVIGGKKRAVGRFVKSPLAPAEIDWRITDFISELNADSTAFEEVMAAIDEKLNLTLPLSQNNFIYGRALVLAEVSAELEFFGGCEWSKLDADIGKFNDIGLSEQKFNVYFGDKNRALDGVCCGFYNGFSKGFTAFGAENEKNSYLNAKPFSVSAKDGVKNVTLFFDPMLKVTINTGILPAAQIEIHAEHTDFSGLELMSAELNTVISTENEAELPDFTRGAVFKRYYPVLKGKSVNYEKLAIINPPAEIENAGKTIITDGLLIETDG
ncbi:MAG: hypothetical protein LBS21_15495 [Clostridiales bacterium]|jgi:hypothetical protein|nr:hypothetical protein [Clostridiales bacterium]